MAENKQKTVFQRLTKSMVDSDVPYNSSNTNSYFIDGDPRQVIYRTTDKDKYDAKKLELQQNRYLWNMWHKVSDAMAIENTNDANMLRLMYRDAELMDQFPEIGAALDIYAEECCVLNEDGHVINIYSESERVKAILTDLFFNRLNIQISAPMIIRGLCKYGNQYELLNMNSKQGITGWRLLPPEQMERYENGVNNPYVTTNGNPLLLRNNIETQQNKAGSHESVAFQWVGQGAAIPFLSWQIAHFRLLTDSYFLPYGTSILHKARRHWKMLSMMEDMMLIYRLDKSVERRVFKIDVGAIDEADVEAYVEDIVNRFKRTPIVDPQTGQLDLRKNMLGTTEDYFIPVRDPAAPNPIDTLAGAQNLTAIDDIKFMQNKVFTALEVPKSFLNFEEAQGNGQNLAMMDVRFTRKANRIQQAFLEELSRIAVIHLYLLGFTDDLTNFQITMNNPSTQAETMEIELLQKKIEAVKACVEPLSDNVPVMSRTNAYREIFHWSNKDIVENLEGIRLDKALATEIEKTPQIIKRTGIFDKVDKIYGEPDAEYQEGQEGEEGGAGGFGGGGGGFGGGSFGGELDSMGDLGGEEGEMPIGEAGEEDSIPETGEAGGVAQESKSEDKNRPLLNEYRAKKVAKSSFENVIDDTFLISEGIDEIIKEIDKYKSE